MKLQLLLTWCLFLLGAESLVLAARQPNVVVILTDDQGWGDLSLHGNTNLSTPHIDHLARAGARFDRFYVCPVCSPTRAEFLTGRYHPRSGVFSTSAGGERLDLDETTIADVFKAAGYATAAFGKWHNGMQYPYHPNGRGFDEFYGFCSGHWGNYFSPPLDHNGEIVQGEGYVVDDFTSKALEFMETHRERPFFVYLPYNTPHSPMQVPDRWWDKFKDRELQDLHREPGKERVPHTRAALAMCENIDWNVGRVLSKLDRLELAEDTIVIYLCDNGPNGARWNARMKGRKGSTDEGGVRSPLFVRWPGTVAPGSTIDVATGAIDLLPTLATLAGIDHPTAEPLDGMSFADLLLKASATSPSKEAFEERTFFSHWRGRVAARRNGFLLDHQGKLFHLPSDPEQRRPVTADEPEIARDLSRQVARWKRETLAGYPGENRPFLIGDEEYRHTQIPARDGTSHGGIKRSNRFPNDSYFTHWKSTEDKVTWPVEVRHAGSYEVTMHYACGEDAVGSTVRLSLGDTAIQKKVTQHHASPIQGGEHDRVERAESYVKDFARMSLGTIDLKEGRGTLTLSVPDMEGAEALEFRLLMFTRED